MLCSTLKVFPAFWRRTMTAQGPYTDIAVTQAGPVATVEIQRPPTIFSITRSLSKSPTPSKPWTIRRAAEPSSSPLRARTSAPGPTSAPGRPMTAMMNLAPRVSWTTTGSCTERRFAFSAGPWSGRSSERYRRRPRGRSGSRFPHRHARNALCRQLCPSGHSSRLRANRHPAPPRGHAARDPHVLHRGQGPR